ncbi:OsmC family protein [Niabella aurantiaca]|uniref:OsmC family protein n=1 Tax=Niabella aurantiaca TaxID=379900 RepID=UPI00036C85A5|nr:OsmC family protein [Niabella aurantiaca]
MSAQKHQYHIKTTWTGNQGEGTASYQAYSRNYTIQARDKPDLYGSSDPAFRGDRQRYNPEELLVAALSSCHMLWYLHLCAEAGIVVTDYTDAARGQMKMEEDGGGCFELVVLCPVVTITDASRQTVALELHQRAHGLCFIARSVHFPVLYEPQVIIQ